jgi:hypothetical protein
LYHAFLDLNSGGKLFDVHVGKQNETMDLWYKSLYPKSPSSTALTVGGNTVLHLIIIMISYSCNITIQFILHYKHGVQQCWCEIKCKCFPTDTSHPHSPLPSP